ncbi:hypothetical protein [Alicyclobacillus dauci]|uniref:Uncharacterized protein n=1 Tax=Alicyclobacillus dauci TaxID=1475485 RepID=A0ABY6Z9J1_9BACL|nr:hypothetical protein [Alicyclobacillus dauci]WAH39217.1 hypothetical protein NZD86_13450 [Alicyclobacillus dauci]
MLWFACALTVLLVVYRMGRISGRREGKRQAEAEIPILLRSQVQLEQHCPICDDRQVYPFLHSQNQG